MLANSGKTDYKVNKGRCPMIRNKAYVVAPQENHILLEYRNKPCMNKGRIMSSKKKDALRFFFFFSFFFQKQKLRKFLFDLTEFKSSNRIYIPQTKIIIKRIYEMSSPNFNL
jgi:hypothetical protein